MCIVWLGYLWEGWVSRNGFLSLIYCLVVMFWFCIVCLGSFVLVGIICLWLIVCWYWMMFSLRYWFCSLLCCGFSKLISFIFFIMVIFILWENLVWMVDLCVISLVFCYGCIFWNFDGISVIGKIRLLMWLLLMYLMCICRCVECIVLNCCNCCFCVFIVVRMKLIGILCIGCLNLKVCMVFGNKCRMVNCICLWWLIVCRCLSCLCW